MSKIILHNGKTVFWNGKTFLNLTYEYSGTYLIDFGSDSYKTNGNWNNITMSNLSINGLIDNSGRTSNIILTTTGFTNAGSGGVDSTYEYPVTASRDYLERDGFVQSSGDVYFTLSGLDDSKLYDFAFFVYDSYNTTKWTGYDIPDSTPYIIVLNYYYDDNEVYIKNVQPINNEIKVRLRWYDSSDNVKISVMKIIEKIPIQYESSSIDSIQVVLDSIYDIQGIGVIKTPLRYDKQYALSYSWDDGMADQYDYGFKYLNGGVAGDSNYYSGKTFTDGCGNEIKFGVGLAIFTGNGANPDVHIPTFEGINILWDEIAEVFDAGWSINNHAYIDGDAASNYQIERNRSRIRLMTSGYTTTTDHGATTKVYTQTSSNYDYHDIVWNITGMTKYYEYMNQNNWQWFGNGKPPYSAGRVDQNLIDGSNIIGYDTWPQTNFDMYRTAGNSSTEVIEALNQLTGATDNDAYHTWKTLICHSVAGNGGGFGSFSDFMTAMDYVEDNYGSKGNDKIWVTGDQNVYEYLYVRGVTDVDYTLTNNILDISLSSLNTNSGNTIPDDLRTYALTLKITGATVSDIIINGGTGCTYNVDYNGDGLINLNWIGNTNQPTKDDYALYFLEIAEGTTSTTDIAVAQDYISAMYSGSLKTTYQSRLDSI